jgi:YfiH family protein
VTSAARRKTSPQKKAATRPPPVLRARNLSALAWLAHGFGTRHLSWSENPLQQATLAAALGGGTVRRPWPLVTLRQVHSDIVHVVEQPPARGDAPLAGDGLLTRRQGILVGVRTADCLPVIVADTEHKAVGVFHAGWRGTLARLVEKGVGQMRVRFGSRPQRLRAALGPCIHACCYEVGAEVRDLYESQFAYAGELFREVFDLDPVREKYPLLFLNARAPGHGEPASKLHLDLVAANRRQLLDAGLAEKSIETLDYCTACRGDLLHSYRRDKEKSGRMLAAAGIRK